MYVSPAGGKCESVTPRNWTHCPNPTFKLGELLDESTGTVIRELEHDRWWVIEESLAVLEQSDEPEDVARVELGRAQQHEIHHWQAEGGAIRDRLCDELEESE